MRMLKTHCFRAQKLKKWLYEIISIKITYFLAFWTKGTKYTVLFSYKKSHCDEQLLAQTHHN
jgi:hypothetical protein